MTTTKIRKVQATGPDGTVADRQSKTKVYTHAVAIHFPAQDGYTIPVGTYTFPAKRIRGFNRPAYKSDVSTPIVQDAQTESFGILSFHTSEVAARKAGQAEVNAYAASAAETREVFGVDARARVTSFRVVEVEVLDEGFNA